MSNDETTKLIEKLKKIKNLAEGEKAVGNEAAAANMSQLLQKLLIQHRISMSTVDAADLTKEEKIVQNRVVMSQHGLQDKAKRIAWCEQLAMVVAKAHGCKILVWLGSNNITFIGRESSVKVCEYTFVTLVRTAEQVCDNEYVKFYAKCAEIGRTERASGFKAGWLVGFISRVAQRFQEELATTESSCALALFQKDIVAVEDFMKGLKTSKVQSTRQNTDNREAIKLGAEFANKVNLRNNAVEQGRSTGPNKLMG